MNGIYFIFFALLTSIFSFLFVKTVLKTKSTSDPIAYAVISFILGSIYAAIFYEFTSFHIQDINSLFTPHVGIFVLLDICAWALGTCFFYPAFKHLPVSETSIVYSLEGFFALIIGLLIFKTETFHLLRLFGGMLILGSVALVNQEKGKWKFNKYTLLLIVSTIIFGLATVLDNVIIAKKYFSSAFFFIILNFGITGLAVLLFSPKTITQLHTIYADKKAFLTVCITSFSTFLTFFFVYNAYKFNILASQSNLILSTQTVLIVLLGSFFFHEKKNFHKKLVAGIIATIGVFLIS